MRAKSDLVVYAWDVGARKANEFFRRSNVTVWAGEARGSRGRTLVLFLFGERCTSLLCAREHDDDKLEIDELLTDAFTVDDLREAPGGQRELEELVQWLTEESATEVTVRGCLAAIAGKLGLTEAAIQ